MIETQRRRRRRLIAPASGSSEVTQSFGLTISKATRGHKTTLPYIILAIISVVALFPVPCQGQYMPNLRTAQQKTPLQTILATDEIKQGLAKHQLQLIPPPPNPPAYVLQPLQYQELSPDKDFSYNPEADHYPNGPDWCFKSNTQEMYWTSEKGSVMLNGKPLWLKGINWYGFETELNVLEGLAVWTPEVFMQFLATHNFNALRLPFSLEWAARDMNVPLPNQYVVKEELRGISQSAVLDRVLEAAAQYGILVVLDLHHLQIDKGIQDLWYDETASPDRVIEIWIKMLKRFSFHWNVFAIDIKNEPHGAATWGRNNPATDWNVFAEKAIAAIGKEVPEYHGLFFVEGVEGSAMYQRYPHWWGENFSGVKSDPIRSGREDLDKRVVYSPHIYGPEVFVHGYFRDPTFPDNMPGIWDEHLGWIEQQTGRAVVVGEWGGSIVGEDDMAAKNQQALAKWLLKACIPDTFWWCLNPHTLHNGNLLNEEYNKVNANVLKMLHYVQPKPTRLKYNKGENSVCVMDGAFVNARCNLRLGLSIPFNQTQMALKAELDVLP